MGVSDRHHFGWLCEALERYERQTGSFAARRGQARDHVIWCLAGQREDRPIAYLRDALGRERTRVEFFDKFPTMGGVRAQDINALDDLPDSACDVVTLFRASMFINDPPSVLAQLRRILRPQGLAVIDWLHGLSDAPRLDLRGDPRHGGATTPFLTTYIDPTFLAEFPEAFEALLRHVNHPPWWANVERPGQRLPVGARIRRLLGGGPRRDVTLCTCRETLRADLKLAGGHLIEPDTMDRHFRVVFRHARYFYPVVKKFNLYLLTVLMPVGK